MRRGLVVLAGVTLWAGCYGATDVNAFGERAPLEGVLGADPTTDPQSPAAPTGGANGVPCAVAEVLSRACASCHGAPPRGAPFALVSYEDLTRASPRDPAQSVLARAVARMSDAASPMPPGGAAAADLAVLKGWAERGAPREACASSPPPAPSEPLPLPKIICSSQELWTDGNKADPRMHPGNTCLACHAQADGPRLAFAGTVYPTPHEQTECYGTKQEGVVEVTDATGRVITAEANNYGNFLFNAGATPLVFPLRARLLFEGRVREMKSPVPNGDCNGCHTELGANGAPGRIYLP